MKTLTTLQKFAALSGILTLFCTARLSAQDLRVDSVLSYQFQSSTDSLITHKKVCTYNSYQGGIGCYNFSICTSSTWDPFSRIWTPEGRTEIKIEDDGKRKFTVYSNYDKTEKKWINSRKDVEYEDPSTSIKETYEWDIFRHRWMKQSEELLRFNKSRQLILRENRDFRKEEGMWYGYKEETSYNPNGYVIERSNANWSHEREVWEPSGRSTYDVDAEGNRVVERNFRWNELNQDWASSTVKRRTYNDEGLLSKVVTVHVNGGHRSEEAYTYNDQGQELTFLSSRSIPGSTDMEPYWRREKRYNAQNKLTYSDFSIWNPDSSAWILDDKTEFTYDANSREVKRLIYGFSWGAPALHLLQESLKEYSAEGKLLNSISYDYDKDELIWRGDRRDFEYDGLGRGIADERWRWNPDSQKFVPHRRTENPYNSQGEINEYAVFDWDTEQAKWVGSALIGWTESENGYFNRFYRGIWNSNTEEWFITHTNLTYNGPCQQEEALAAPESDLRYYPNPVQAGVLSLEMPIDQSYSLEILDLQGRVVHQGQVEGPFAEVELNVTSSGVYLIRFKNDTEEILDRIIITNP